MSPPFSPPGPFSSLNEPSEVRAVRSTLRIVRILALLLGLIFLLIGVATVVGGVVDFLRCVGSLGCDYPIGSFFWGPLVVAFAFLDGLLFLQTRRIEGMMERRQYAEARETTLLWAILGLIAGAIILGVFLLIAYLDIERLASTPWGGAPPFPAARSGGDAPWAVSPATAPPVPPPPAAASGPAPCPRCGRPVAFIPQYGRYYCFSCAMYP